MKKSTFKLLNNEAETYSIELPSKKEVCPRCDGEGTHDHEAFTGLTCDSDYEEREAYYNGEWDVTCTKCHGDRVIDVVNEKYITEEQKELIKVSDEMEIEIAEQEAEDAECYRAECGYAW